MKTFPAWSGAILTGVVNLALGWVTLLPAAFAVLAISVNVFGAMSTDYNSDKGFYQVAGLLSGTLIAGLFIAVNAAIQYMLPGRRMWLWSIAVIVYPIPYLVDLWSSR